MSEQSKIKALSEIMSPQDRNGNAVVMVGSFAPIHEGHFDAIYSASDALGRRGVHVESLILAPNSSEYLNGKLAGESEPWTYERRTNLILDRSSHPTIPTYVDDISGNLAQEKQINEFVPKTVQRHLGFKAMQMYLVVGSDQLLSMNSHLSNEDHKAVCVLRPGNLNEIQDHLNIGWVSEAIESERLIMTERGNMDNDISSTAIRKSVVIDLAH